MIRLHSQSSPLSFFPESIKSKSSRKMCIRDRRDGAAAAQVLNEGKELSLSSLLSAVRTRKKAGMDVSVDDSFGMEKEVIASKNSISEQIYAAYGQNIAADLMGKLSPQVLKEAMGGNEEISRCV